MRLGLAVLILAALPVAALAASSPVVAEHDLTITLNPEQHILTGSDRMVLAAPAEGGAARFALHKGLKVLRAFWAGGELEVQDGPALPGDVARSITVAFPGDAQVDGFTLEYTGGIYDPVQKSAAVGFVRGDDTTGIVSEDGVFLHGGTTWVPRGGETQAIFKIRVRIPKPWTAVTEGNLVSRTEEGDVRVSEWVSPLPVDGPTLAANRFHVEGKDFGAVRVSAYFLEDDKALAKDYVEAAGRYLDFYTKLLGPYPFTRFDIVENFFTTGYGMPGYTLLGPQVVKMAHFGSRTLGPHSLGHELVHCWWGNGVYTPRGGGNWCEGLTTYCANYYWVERFEDPAKAREYRRKAFLRYSIFVDEKNDYPVRRFGSKSKEVDDFIGYTKSSMVLHTLRGLVGDEAFFGGLRRVREGFLGKAASWEDFQAAFERESGRELGWFFRQWIDGTGAPSLALRDVGVRGVEAQYAVSARIEQTGGAFTLHVPVVAVTPSGRVRTVAEVGPGGGVVELLCAERPLRLEVDPDFEVFRRLAPEEIAPCLEYTLSHDTAMVVYPTGGTAEENAFYEGFARRYQGSSRRIPAKADADVTAEDLASRSLLVLGGAKINAVTAKLGGLLRGDDLRIGADAFTVKGVTYAEETQSALVSVPNPLAPGRQLTLYVALSPAGMQRARLIAHYGWESFLVYDARRPREVLARGDFAAGANPCVADLAAPAPAVSAAVLEGGAALLGPGEAFVHRFDGNRRMSFAEMIEELAAYDAVFVGEYHNDWATHNAEAEILKGLSGRGREVAVSMEMFERDVQPVLDAYLKGQIPERDFLARSRPWGNYFVGYREIVEFAKANGMAVIAANVPRPIASKIARGGEKALDELSAEERPWAARELKAPEGAYKDRFIRVMLGGGGHGGPPSAMAERFYLSQCLKDDTMAESMADYINRPGHGDAVVIHYNGSFHSDAHLGTVEKFEALMPSKKVVVVKILSERDLLAADPESWRGEADYLLVCRKRGEDLQDGTYAFNVARRVRFLPAVPRGFEPSAGRRAVVAFHDAGGAPKDLSRLLQLWGFGDCVLIVPEGLRHVWNADGSPGYEWFGPERGAEETDVVAAFGAELADLLRTSYGIAPDGVRFLGLGAEGGRAAALCAAGFGAPTTLVTVGGSAMGLPGLPEGSRVVLLNARGKAPEGVEVEQVEQAPVAECDAMGAAVARAFGFDAPGDPALDRARTVVLSLDRSGPFADSWAFRIQKDLERSLKARVFLHREGGAVSLADLFLSLRVRGVERVVHQPLGGPIAAVFPEWAREEMEARLETLPPLTLADLLSEDTLPPQPTSRFTGQNQFVLLVTEADGAGAADAAREHVRAAGLKAVKVVEEAEGLDALKRALAARPAGGMPGMGGFPPNVYVLRAAFAAETPTLYLPVLYRHNDENLHLRAGLGCLNTAKAILKRLKAE